MSDMLHITAFNVLKSSRYSARSVWSGCFEGYFQRYDGGCRITDYATILVHRPRTSLLVKDRHNQRLQRTVTLS
jgi:hypothetical protein